MKDVNNQRKIYNQLFTTSEEYSKPYIMTKLFPMWQFILTKVERTSRILELGCGTGQLARLLYDNGISDYVGIDISEVGIHKAQQLVPSYTFIREDLQKVVYEDFVDYTILSTQVFEHIEDDLMLIKKLPKTRLIFSVSGADHAAHFRVYSSEEYIREYYKDVLNVYSVNSFCKVKVSPRFVIDAYIK